MATHASAEKAARQAAARTKRNQAVKAECKTVVKKVKSALAANPQKNEETKKNILALLNDAQRVLMKAASKNIMKSGTASRYISRLSSAIHRA